MAEFGQKSLERLATCHPDIQSICREAIKLVDFSVLEGVRSTSKQMQYYAEGKSKLDGVTRLSKHQVTSDDQLSRAIDIAPYPIDFSDTRKKRERFYYLAGVIKAIAKSNGVELIWGGDWDSDNEFDDQSFDDLPHFEIVRVKIN